MFTVFYWGGNHIFPKMGGSYPPLSSLRFPPTTDIPELIPVQIRPSKED